MCGSMVDIQSPAAEIRRGKKKDRNHSMKIYMVSLLHRATIIMRFLHHIVAEKQISLGTHYTSTNLFLCTDIKSISIFECLNGIHVFRNFTIQKHDGQTN